MALAKELKNGSQGLKLHAYLKYGPDWYHLYAQKLMGKVDALPLEWRLLVHEFGWNKVHEQMARGRDARKAFIALSLTQVDLDL